MENAATTISGPLDTPTLHLRIRGPSCLCFEIDQQKAESRQVMENNEHAATSFLPGRRSQ